ncbi:MAG: STAS domain-containing protein [Clostridia bacterium]|nr:STAS domain-containing protein [Clostridia bacterium]
MELTTQKNGAELTVALSGELNTLTAPELAGLLEKELGGAQTLTLDFTDCDYVSSAGLRVLLGTYKQMKAAGGEMRLSNVGENFLDVLQNTGLDSVFDVQ